MNGGSLKNLLLRRVGYAGVFFFHWIFIAPYLYTFLVAALTILVLESAAPGE